MRNYLFYLIGLGYCLLSPVLKAQPASIKSGLFENGSVVCAQPIAANIGAAVLKSGGNAFDAAIATQLALAVVYPQAGNIGGGGFMIARKPDGAVLALDFRETAPLASTSDMYLDQKGNAVMSRSQDGHLSAGVPGSIAGIFKMYLHARLPFKRLIEPAIQLAEQGFAITAGEAALFNRFQGDFKKYNQHEVAFVKNGGWKPGDILIQKDLAKTLRRIENKGSEGFYSGKTRSWWLKK